MSKSKQKATNGDDAKYVKLLVHARRRAFVIFTTAILTALFSSWIWINLAQKRGDHWFLFSLPLIFIGLLANFVQPVEEWSYGPWQEATQKYEKNIYN
jgi:hypothetical protein